MTGPALTCRALGYREPPCLLQKKHKCCREWAITYFGMNICHIHVQWLLVMATDILFPYKKTIMHKHIAGFHNFNWKNYYFLSLQWNVIKINRFYITYLRKIILQIILKYEYLEQGQIWSLKKMKSLLGILLPNRHLKERSRPNSPDHPKAMCKLDSKKLKGGSLGFSRTMGKLLLVKFWSE